VVTVVVPTQDSEHVKQAIVKEETLLVKSAEAIAAEEAGYRQ